MQTKTLLLAALSATSALAGPAHGHALFRRHPHTHMGSWGAPTAADPFWSASSTGMYTLSSAEPVETISVSTIVASLTSTKASIAAVDNLKVVRADNMCAGAVVTSTIVNYVTVQGRVADTSSAAAATSSVSYPSVATVAASSSASSKPSTTFATVASSAKSSAAASSSSVASSHVASSGNKKGISYNTASNVQPFVNAISWAYNWGSTSSGLSSTVEFVPMMWGLNQVSGFASSIGSATHVLSFNEPDLSSQSNIDPVTAAAQHIAGLKSLFGKVQIGSPAVTNGAGTSPLMGIDWLNAFFSACNGQCGIDFVAFHWYADAGDISYFKQHVTDVINCAAANGVSRVWLTEFLPSGSASDQATFMTQAVEFLDATPQVERYAPFMAADGDLMSGSALNSVGQAFASSQ